MKQITLNIPENKFNFIIEQLKKFTFVKVVKQEELKKGAPKHDNEEHDDWAHIAMQGLERAYTEDDDDYDSLVVIEPNPEYNPWKKGK